METTKKPIFAGEFRHSMDAKNRVAVPSSWRQRSTGDFFLIPSQGGDHLLGYPPDEFEKVSRLVIENPAISPQDQRIFMRQFYSKAQLCSLDRQGRLLVPSDLRRLAALEGDLLLVGAFNRFEIWNPARWGSVAAQEQATYAQIANVVGL